VQALKPELKGGGDEKEGIGRGDTAATQSLHKSLIKQEIPRRKGGQENV
jgi:hypothetical protein